MLSYSYSYIKAFWAVCQAMALAISRHFERCVKLKLKLYQGILSSTCQAIAIAISRHFERYLILVKLLYSYIYQGILSGMSWYSYSYIKAFWSVCQLSSYSYSYIKAFWAVCQAISIAISRQCACDTSWAPGTDLFFAKRKGVCLAKNTGTCLYDFACFLWYVTQGSKNAILLYMSTGYGFVSQ